MAVASRRSESVVRATDSYQDSLIVVGVRRIHKALCLFDHCKVRQVAVTERQKCRK